MNVFDFIEKGGSEEELQQHLSGLTIEKLREDLGAIALAKHCDRDPTRHSRWAIACRLVNGQLHRKAKEEKRRAGG